MRSFIQSVLCTRSLILFLTYTLCLCRCSNGAADVRVSGPFNQTYLSSGGFASNVKMSKTFIGGAVCREFESEAPAAEEMLDCVVCSREQFSFQMCLDGGDGSGTFRIWRQTAGAVMQNALE